MTDTANNVAIVEDKEVQGYLNEVSAVAEGIIELGVPVFETMPNKVAQTALANAMAGGESLSDARDASDSKEFIVPVVGLAFSRGEIAVKVGGIPTGEIKDAVITTFLTADGRGLVASSPIIYKSVMGILTVMGTPKDWKKPIKFSFSMKKNGDKQMNIVRVVD